MTMTWHLNCIYAKRTESAGYRSRSFVLFDQNEQVLAAKGTDLPGSAYLFGGRDLGDRFGRLFAIAKLFHPLVRRVDQLGAVDRLVEEVVASDR